MKLIPIKRSEKDQKQQISELLKNHADKRIVIMMSMDYFNIFTSRSDVEKIKCRALPADHLEYLIYKNALKDKHNLLGLMHFQLIGGLIFIKYYSYLHYQPYGDEADKIFFLE